jgi:uncharacterized membrane protein
MKPSCPPKKSKLLIFLISFLLFSFLLRLPVFAQESVILTVKPVRIGDDNSLLLAPGEKKQIQVKVENNSDRDLEIVSQVFDFIVADDGTTPIPVIDQQDNRWSLASWITLAPAYNYLRAGGSATVNVLIEVPEDATPGGHYAMVLHSPNFTGVEGQRRAGITQRAGTLIYVLVDGAITETAYVSRFSVPRFLEKGPVPMEIKIRNESDIHITPSPKITVKNIFGKEVATMVLDAKNVFPFTERDFSDVWDKKWGFGPYTLSLEAAYGIQGQTMTAQAVIWLIPVTIIIIILLSILLIMAVVTMLKKKKEQQRRALLTKAEDVTKAENAKRETQPVDDQKQQ